MTAKKLLTNPPTNEMRRNRRVSQYIPSIIQSLGSIFKMMDINEETRKIVFERLDSFCVIDDLIDYKLKNEVNFISSDLPSDFFPDPQVDSLEAHQNFIEDDYVVDSSFVDLMPY